MSYEINNKFSHLIKVHNMEEGRSTENFLISQHSATKGKESENTVMNGVNF